MALQGRCLGTLRMHDEANMAGACAHRGFSVFGRDYWCPDRVCTDSPRSSVCFLTGVSLIVISTLVAAAFGLRRAELPLDSLVKVLSATFSKWLLIFAAVYFALTHWQLAALPLILGVIAAQLSAIGVGLRQPKY